MDFSKDQKKEAYKALADAQKEFVTSASLTSTVMDIAGKNGLMLDAAGKLNDVIFLTLIGLLKVEDMPSRLGKELNVSGDALQKILGDANAQVFSPYRQLLMKADFLEEDDAAPSAPAQAPATAPAGSGALAGVSYATPAPVAPAPAAPTPVLRQVANTAFTSEPATYGPATNREDILAEIENPTPVDHPISAAAPLPAFPRAMEIMEAPKEEKMAAAKEFVVSKLSQTVASPAQQASIDPDKFTQKPKGYEADPYRESIS